MANASFSFKEGRPRTSSNVVHIMAEDACRHRGLGCTRADVHGASSCNSGNDLPPSLTLLLEVPGLCVVPCNEQTQHGVSSKGSVVTTG